MVYTSFAPSKASLISLICAVSPAAVFSMLFLKLLTSSLVVYTLDISSLIPFAVLDTRVFAATCVIYSFEILTESSSILSVMPCAVTLRSVICFCNTEYSVFPSGSHIHISSFLMKRYVVAVASSKNNVLWCLRYTASVYVNLKPSASLSPIFGPDVQLYAG